MMGLLGLLGGAFKALAVWLGFMERRADQKAGAVAQAAQDTQEAVKVEAAVAQAAVDAPKSQAEVMAALNAGTF